MPRFHRALACVALALAAPLHAATFAVTRFDDPVPDGCAALDCSLREAVIAANLAAGPDQIPLEAGDYLLTQYGGPGPGAGTDDLDVVDRLEIVGKGSGLTSIVADYPYNLTDTRILEVVASGLTLRGVSLRKGKIVSVGFWATEGGCFRAENSRIAFDDVQVSECFAVVGGGVSILGGSARFDATTIRLSEAMRGGGLALLGTTLAEGSGVLLELNAATLRGGGIFASPAPLPALQTGTTTLRWATGSQVVANHAPEGGGVAIASGQTLVVDPLADATPGDDELLFVAGNVASSGGGGLHNLGILQAKRLAVRSNASNGAGSDGGGLLTFGNATLTDSEFAFNTAVRDGGGAMVRNGASARFERVSFADNHVGRFGGGLSNQGYALLVNVSTFSNDALAGGGLDFQSGGRMIHVSLLGDSGNALRAPAGPVFKNSVVSGGCAPGSVLALSGSNAQAAGFAPCGGMPTHAAAQLALAYAYTGGRFDAVAITAPGSVLRNAAVLLPEATNDIRGWARVGASDIGAHEFDAIGP